MNGDGNLGEGAALSAVRMVGHAIDVFAVCLGVAVLAGGTTRMTRPGYGPLLDLAAPWVWGAALLGAGILAAARTPWVSALGYTAIAVWCFTFATGFILVLVGSESGATTAPVVYLTMVGSRRRWRGCVGSAIEERGQRRERRHLVGADRGRGVCRVRWHRYGLVAASEVESGDGRDD